VAAAGAEAGEGEDEEEDEEALLKRQEPDIAEKVIDEDAEAATPPVPVPVPAPRRVVTEAPPTPPPAPSRPALPRASSSERKPASKEVAASRESAKDPASVRIESKPDGAVIKLGSRVFGRAPMNLRFRPGVTYELTFVKQGYESTRRRFTASARKGQRVTVSLKKRSASAPASGKRKGFFQRLLGGLKRQNR
jgi:hypothetical protein